LTARVTGWPDRGKHDVDDRRVDEVGERHGAQHHEGELAAAAVMKLGEAKLNEMIAEATVDAHDEDEQLTGFTT
jgi:hypothetical protein